MATTGGPTAESEHHLPQMWAANPERLRRSDPDLFVGVAPVPSPR